ncbi:MAG TPA: hypothetical protein EYQ66_13330 [Myxococcales bacterium]|nr:hypothetical protein [Myxococcales bacterium]
MLVIEYPDQRGRNPLTSAHVDPAAVEARSRKLEQAGKLRIEYVGVVHDHGDRPLGPEAQIPVRPKIGLFKDLQDILFEPSGPAEARAFVDVHILEKDEVRRIALAEFPVGASVQGCERTG